MRFCRSLLVAAIFASPLAPGLGAGRGRGQCPSACRPRIPPRRPKTPRRSPKTPPPKTPRGRSAGRRRPPPDAPEVTPANVAAGLAALGKKGKSGEPQPYDKVIPKDAKTQAGVFRRPRGRRQESTSRSPPTSSKSSCCSAPRSRAAPAGTSFNGQELGTKFVRFERRENKIFVIEANFDKRATDAQGDRRLGRRADHRRLQRRRRGQGPLRGHQRHQRVPDRLARRRGQARRRRRPGRPGAQLRRVDQGVPDQRRGPRAQLTFRAGQGGAAIPGLPAVLTRGAGGSSKTALVHYSLYLLPEQPMQGRFFDPARRLLHRGLRRLLQ